MGGHGSVAFSISEGDSNNLDRHSFIFYGVEPVFKDYSQKCKRSSFEFDYVKKTRFRFNYLELFQALKKQRPTHIILHSTQLIVPVIIYSIIEILVVAGVMLILLYSSSPDIYPDTQRFLSGNLHDPPLYSALIYIMQLVFGSLNSVIILQTLFVGFGIIYFTRTVAIHFNLDIIIKSIVALFLFIPILQFYNSLITEPISYAFSLLFVSFVIKLIYNFSIQNIVWSTIFVIVLLLTRNQFLFLYPVVLLLYLGILILYSSKKTFAWLLISFLSIFIIHNASINLNKYMKKDH